MDLGMETWSFADLNAAKSLERKGLTSIAFVAFVSSWDQPNSESIV
jgi:hypothetical protein